jgi:hypothetical protein
VLEIAHLDTDRFPESSYWWLASEATDAGGIAEEIVVRLKSRKVEGRQGAALGDLLPSQRRSAPRADSTRLSWLLGQEMGQGAPRSPDDLRRTRIVGNRLKPGPR